MPEWPEPTFSPGDEHRCEPSELTELEPRIVFFVCRHCGRIWIFGHDDHRWHTTQD